MVHFSVIFTSLHNFSNFMIFFEILSFPLRKMNFSRSQLSSNAITCKHLSISAENPMMPSYFFRRLINSFTSSFTHSFYKFLLQLPLQIPCTTSRIPLKNPLKILCNFLLKLWIQNFTLHIPWKPAFENMHFSYINDHPFRFFFARTIFFS